MRISDWSSDVCSSDLGSVWPIEKLREVRGVAKRHGLGMHMDGARLMNAAVSAGVKASAFASICDSAWVDLSKGLGCPVGAVLCGSKDFVEEAWRWKQDRKSTRLNSSH